MVDDPTGEQTPRRPSETLAVVSMVVSTLNEVITALREEVAALAASDRRGRKLLDLKLALLGIAVAISLLGVALTYNQASNVKSIVDYISNCQKPGSPCKKQNDAVIGGAVNSIAAKAYDSITCVLLTPPPSRTDENVKTCRDKYLK